MLQRTKIKDNLYTRSVNPYRVITEQIVEMNLKLLPLVHLIKATTKTMYMYVIDT